MPIARALRLCPDATCVPVPFKECWQKSREIRQVLQQFTPVVEGASVDEWYLDMSGTEGITIEYWPRRQRIRDGVRTATGLTLSIEAARTSDRQNGGRRVAQQRRGRCDYRARRRGDVSRTCTLAEIRWSVPSFSNAWHSTASSESKTCYDTAARRSSNG
jgi:hypothetical protein